MVCCFQLLMCFCFFCCCFAFNFFSVFLALIFFFWRQGVFDQNIQTEQDQTLKNIFSVHAPLKRLLTCGSYPQAVLDVNLGMYYIRNSLQIRSYTRSLRSRWLSKPQIKSLVDWVKIKWFAPFFTSAQIGVHFIKMYTSPWKGCDKRRLRGRGSGACKRNQK